MTLILICGHLYDAPRVGKLLTSPVMQKQEFAPFAAPRICMALPLSAQFRR